MVDTVDWDMLTFNIRIAFNTFLRKMKTVVDIMRMQQAHSGAKNQNYSLFC